MQPGSWLYEIKFAGYRRIALRGANETRILSRNKKDLRKKFPGIVESVAAPDVQGAIIDDENRGTGREGPVILPIAAGFRH
jgi:bifunctional non-homologous end joining protein LigD